MKRPTLRDMDQSAFTDQAVAAALPKSWKEAIKAYVAWRTEQLKEPLMDLVATSEFKAKDISLQCAALVEIEKRLAKDVKSKPTLRIVEPDKRQRVQHDVDLASLLTPSNWEKLYGPVLETIRAEAETEILKQQNIRANQALGAELLALVKFLHGTEERGRRATADMQRGLDPRRTQNSAVRMVM